MTIEESSTPRVHEEAKAVSSTPHRDSTDFALESIGAAASTPRVPEKANVVSPTHRKGPIYKLIELEPIGASSTPRDHEKSTLVACGRFIYTYYVHISLEGDSQSSDTFSTVCL